MKKIWKYQVEPQFSLEVPEDSTILSLQVQGGEPCMWMLVDPSLPLVTRFFVCIPTGDTFDETGKRFIATIQVDRGLVFHVFETEWEDVG